MSESVFGVVMAAGEVRMVAAQSKTAAMGLLAVSQYRMENYPAELSDKDRHVAMQEPGVWVRDAGADDWRKPVEGELSRSETKGGAREGVRRPIGAAPAKLRSLRLTDEDWSVFLALGGAQWLRERLRRAKKKV